MSKQWRDPQIDVLIVNYLSKWYTQRAAAAVSGPGVSIFVADNSQELTPRDLPAEAILVKNDTNLLYARANNQLWGLGQSELVLLLNPDVTLSSHDLRVLAGALLGDENAWGAAPDLRNEDGSRQDYFRRAPRPLTMTLDRIPFLRRVWNREWMRHTYADMDRSKQQAIEAPPGACILLRRSLVGAQLFDPTLGLFYNDTDLAVRLNRSGYCLYVPEVSAEHVRGASLTAERLRNRYAIAAIYDRNAVQFARKHFGSWWLLVAAISSARRLLTRVLVLLERVAH